MKKSKQLIFTKILYSLFTIMTILSLFIVYKNSDNDLSFKFLVGYIFLVFFMLAYVPLIAIVNTRKYKWVYIRKSIFKFIALFILLSILNYVFDYIIRPSKIDLFSIFSTSAGLSFGIAFFNIMFLKEDRWNQIK